jgi:putative sterol carrier protein
MDTSVAPGATIQWDFSDAEPWHVRVVNGTAEASPGRIEHPDLLLHVRFRDWLDLSAGRIEPWRAVLSGRIRPRGKLRMLVRLPKLFG